MPFVVIALVFWFLLIRPQRKRQLEMLATQRAVTAGDEVLLGAGIVGRVVGEADDFLELEIAPGVPMKVARGAVVRVMQPETTEPSIDATHLTDTTDTTDTTGTPGATGATRATDVTGASARTEPADRTDPTNPSRDH